MSLHAYSFFFPFLLNFFFFLIVSAEPEDDIFERLLAEEQSKLEAEAAAPEVEDPYADFSHNQPQVQETAYEEPPLEEPEEEEDPDFMALLEEEQRKLALEAEEGFDQEPQVVCFVVKDFFDCL